MSMIVTIRCDHSRAVVGPRTATGMPGSITEEFCPQELTLTDIQGLASAIVLLNRQGWSSRTERGMTGPTHLCPTHTGKQGVLP